MERPTLIYITKNFPPAIVIPELEKAKLDAVSFNFIPYTFGEDPEKWKDTFSQVANDLNLAGRNIGVEPTRLRYLEYKFLENSLSKAIFLPGDQLISDLRIIKDTNEIDFMQKAVMIAQEALQLTLPSVRAGITEKELASELVFQTLKAGSDPELPFSPIVAFGPNTANPHSTPSNQILKPGELILFDWGATKNGYFSDLTRTFQFGSTQLVFIEIAKVVHEANLAAQAKVRPGIATGKIDQSARSVIKNAGYGDNFIHRTGHGLGVEAHEEPYIRADNKLLLKSGMTFTIEPGIYFQGLGGVRIEDNILVTDNGYISLSDLPRELIQIG